MGLLGVYRLREALEGREFSRWFTTLLEDVDRLADGLDEHRARLVALQHALLEVINLLDPTGARSRPSSANLYEPHHDRPL